MGSQLKIECPCESDEGGERRVGPLGREEASDRLRLHSCSPSELCLGEAELGPAVIECADEQVDLLDALSRLLVGGPVVRILESGRQVTLRTGAWLSHEGMLAVTFMLRIPL